jgi:hypothetical protein
MLVLGVGELWGQTKVSDGVYYIKNSNEGGDKWYLWPAITVTKNGNNFQYAYKYLTTHDGKTADAVDQDGVVYPAHDDTYCRWIVKNTEGKIQLINPKLNKYVVIPQNKVLNSGKDVVFADEPTGNAINYSYFVLNNDNSPYKISPPSGLDGINYGDKDASAFSFNSKNGTDRTWLTWSSQNSNIPHLNDNSVNGLIQFYSSGTPTWSFELVTLEEPTISDVNPETNQVTVIGPDWLPEGYKIHYTFSADEEPDNPTATSSEMTDGEFTVPVAGTLKVVVVRYGVVLSAVKSKFVEPQCKTPVITYSAVTGKVSITSDTPNAIIYYTLDESDPASSSTREQYTAPFSVADRATVKAIATKSGFKNSEIASVRLVLNPTITLAENELTYNGSAKEPAVNIVKNGDTTIPASEYTVTYSNNINAGNEAVVKITDAEGGDYIVYGSKTFTINPAGVTLTANSGTEAYDGTEKTVTGFASSVNGLTFEGVNASGSGTNAGEYDVTLTGVTINTTKDTSGNYVVTSTVNGKLTITPKALTIIAKPVTITYGEEPANDGVTYGEFAPGEDESVLSGTLAYAYNYAQYDDAGNYTITPSGLSNDNYNITFAPGVLTVAKKEVGLTWDETTSFVYDGSAHAPTATASGMINGDVISVTVIGAQTNAGDYTATASLTGDKASSYQLPDAHTQEFSITKVPLTITANNNAITYGNAPAGNGVTCEGFVNSETASVLGGTLDYDYSYTQYGDVGNTYTITPKGLTSVNYEITFAAGTLTVNAKEVSLSWGETTFEYDGSPHAPIATAIGLVNSDVVTVTVTGAQINVGNYTATASALTGDKAGNYLLPDDNTQSFTISRRNIGSGTLVSGYTLDFGEDNTILLTDDNIGRTLVLSTDYSVGDDTDPSAKYSERRVTGQGNYTGYFDVRNVVISFTTDTDQEDWSATFSAEKADESDVGLALPEGVSAFIISGIQGEWAIPEPLNYIPAGVPVLLVAHKKINGFVATQTENGDVTPITDAQKTKNMLEEVTENTPGYDPVSESAPFTTKQIYLLYKNEFVFNKAGNMKKGKVYLNPNHAAPSPEPAPSRLQIAWNYTTGIEDGKGKMDEGRCERWYTLDGRCLSGKPDAKGLYIVGGKKIVVK